MDNNDKILLGFNNITQFVGELSKTFGKRYKPIKLYHILLSRTEIRNVTQMSHNVELFQNFCIENRNCILEQKTPLKSPKISYSKNVTVDFSIIFSLCEDKETTQIIWKYLLKLSALFDPVGKAKEVLENMSSTEDSKEAEFLNNLFTKVESASKSNSDPASIVQSIMNPDMMGSIFNSLGGTGENSLDLGKLVGTMTNMLGKMSEQSNDPTMKNMVGMLSNLTTQIQSGDNTPPDLSGMLSALGGSNPQLAGMLSSLTEQKK